MIRQTDNLVLLLAGCLYCLAALRTLITRKPSLLSSRWMVVFLFVVVLPVLLKPSDLIFTLLYCIFLILYWRREGTGCIADGVSQSYFRDALRSSIRKLGYTPEESTREWRISETGDAFRVSIQAWLGSAQLRPAKTSSPVIARKLFQAMKEYFAATPDGVKYTGACSYFIVGILFIALALRYHI